MTRKREKASSPTLSLLQESEGLAFRLLERVLVAETRRDRGLAQAHLSLECQRDPVRGQRRHLRRQGNHQGTVKAEQRKVADADPDLPMVLASDPSATILAFSACG